MITKQRHTTLTIDPRHAGLPGIALGGYSSGLAAASLGTPAAEVRLRRPVPLERELTFEHTEAGGVELRDGATLLAAGAPAELELEVPEAPSFEEAVAAAEHFPGFHAHPYPHCFACGPERAHGDGLRVFPGSVGGRRLVATPWTPSADGDGSGEIGPELIWGAFDCAQLWALMIDERGNPGERMVTAALAGRSYEPVQPGVPHVLMAWSLGRDGDTLRAGAALVGPEGGVRAVGLQTAVIAKWGVPLDFLDE